MSPDYKYQGRRDGLQYSAPIPIERYDPKTHSFKYVTIENCGYRPHYGGGWVLQNEAHDFLVKNNIEYAFSFQHVNEHSPNGGVWCIEVIGQSKKELENAILMVKLRFGLT